MVKLRSKYSSNTNATWRKYTYLLRGRTHKRRHSRVSKKWKKNYTHSRLLAFALAFTSNTCVSMLQHCWKGKVLFRFVSSWIWGACGVDVSVCIFLFFFSFAFQQQQRKIPYLAKVDESPDLVTELETSEFHDQFHQQSALRARSQN